MMNKNRRSNDHDALAPFAVRRKTKNRHVYCFVVSDSFTTGHSRMEKRDCESIRSQCFLLLLSTSEIQLFEMFQNAVQLYIIYLELFLVSVDCERQSFASLILLLFRIFRVIAVRQIVLHYQQKPWFSLLRRIRNPCLLRFVEL